MSVQAQENRPAGALPPPDLPAADAAPLISAVEDEQEAAPAPAPSVPAQETATEPAAGTEARRRGDGQSTQFSETGQTRPGEVPPKVGGEQPPADINIRRARDRTVEEYSINGRIYMVRVVPDNGIPYYFIDTDGDGRLESRMGENHMEPVKPVTYKLLEWD